MTLLPFAQFINVVSIALAVLLLVLAYLVLPSVDFNPAYGPDDTALQTWTIILAAALLLLLVVVFSLPRLLSRCIKQTYSMLFSVQALRAVALALIGLLGFVLVLLGAAAWISACFFAVSAVGFLLNYPIRSRWEKLLEDDPSRPALLTSKRNPNVNR